MRMEILNNIKELNKLREHDMEAKQERKKIKSTSGELSTGFKSEDTRYSQLVLTHIHCTSGI